MGKNYVVYHLHSDLSNSSTPDSTTKFEEYIDLALKNNMKALGFSEHGGVYEWVRKKQAMDKVGLKYIDRKSTRLNSSHVKISYAVFCLKKKKKKNKKNISM